VFLKIVGYCGGKCPVGEGTNGLMMQTGNTVVTVLVSLHQEKIKDREGLKCLLKLLLDINSLGFYDGFAT